MSAPQPGQPRRAYSFGHVTNFRDLGGYDALDGRTTRWGRLYRSNSLALLTEADREPFAELGIRTVIDLRRPTEVRDWGRIPYADIEYHNIAPIHQEWDEVEYDETLGTPAFLAERYLDLAVAGAAGYAETIRIISAPGGTPAVVHCFAGKDRTGVFAGLVLGLLGVADEVIAADYQLSEAWAAQAPSNIPAHFVASPAAAMEGFLKLLRANYGSLPGYGEFAGLSGAEITDLRAALLEG